MDEQQNNIKLFTALSKFQSNLKKLTKDKEAKVITKKGGNYSYKYASLGSILDHVKSELGKNELSVVQVLNKDEGFFGLVTMLSHSSGGQIISQYPLPDPRQIPPQDFGSQLTYARRYSITSILGLESDDDDDAQRSQKEYRNQGQDSNARRAQSKPAVQKYPGGLTYAQVKKAYAIAKNMGFRKDDFNDLLRSRWEVDSMKDFPSQKFQELIESLDPQPPEDPINDAAETTNQAIQYQSPNTQLDSEEEIPF